MAHAQPAPVVTPDPEPPAEVAPAPEPEPQPEKKPDKKKSIYEPHVNGYLQVAWKAAIDTNDDGHASTPVFRIERARVELDGKVMKKIGYALGIDAGAGD